MKIGVDMDEVICDTHLALVTWAERAFGLDLQARLGEPTRALLTDEQFGQMIDMLNEGSIFRDLVPMEGAVEVLSKLAAKHEVFIVTAAMEHPASMPHKFDWIAKHLPFFDPLNIIFCGHKSVIDVDYLIDDSPHHFERLRGEGIVYSAPRNMAETRYKRVSNWGEVASFFGV